MCYGIENHMVIYDEEDYNELYNYKEEEHDEYMEEKMQHELDDNEQKKLAELKEQIKDGRDDKKVMLRNSHSNEVQSREDWIIEYVEGGTLYNEDQSIQEFLEPLVEVQASK